MYHPDVVDEETGLKKSLLQTMFDEVTDHPIMQYVGDKVLKANNSIFSKNTDVWHELNKLKDSDSFYFNGEMTGITPEWGEDIKRFMDYAAATKITGHFDLGGRLR